MNKYVLIGLSIVVLLGIGVGAVAWYSNDSQAYLAQIPVQTPLPFRSDFANMRIESEAKLVVPPAILEDVWAYMLQRCQGKNRAIGTFRHHPLRDAAGKGDYLEAIFTYWNDL